MLSLLSKQKYQTLNLIEVKKKSLLANYNYFQKLRPQTKICPVLKSNAYGHGLSILGKFVDEEIKPEFICVDSLFEAYELEKKGIKTPILIMGYTLPGNFKFKKIDFRIPVFDENTAKILNQYQPGIKIHLKIDTGMNRLGIKESDIDRFISSLSSCTKIIIEGIYSHLADADSDSDKFSRQQIETFKRVIRKFENKGIYFKYKHLFATAGAFRFNEPEFNLIRLGTGFYGISPFPVNSKDDRQLQSRLSPALKYISHLAEIKEIKEGETVSYGRTFKAKKKMKIGILPLGYYDGLDRRLSNRGLILINNVYCQIIGNICMNVSAIDISGVSEPYVGQEVVIYDNKKNSKNSVRKSADLTETISYDILAKLSETTKRVLT